MLSSFIVSFSIEHCLEKDGCQLFPLSDPFTFPATGYPPLSTGLRIQI